MSQIVRNGTSVALVDDDFPPGRESVRILRAGVCGTDIQIASGVRPDRARILGHEAVGVDPSGALVVFNPVDAHDQERILGHTYDGIFRPNFPAGDEMPGLVAVAGGLPLDLVALCEPVAAVLYGWDIADSWQSARAVGIWGAGPMGIMHARECVKRGLRVTLTHPRLGRCHWLRSGPLGDTVQYRLPGGSDHTPIDLAYLCTDRHGIDVALAEALRVIVPGGLVVLVGGVPRRFRTPLFVGSPDLSEVRRRNVSGDIASNGIARMLVRDTRYEAAVSGHRGSSASQIARAYGVIADDVEFFATLVTHRVEPEVAVHLMNARCRGAEHDTQGREIVKIVIRFGDREAI